jgi:hypothetical protein
VSSQDQYERVAVELLKRMIAERGEPTPLPQLLTIYPALRERGVLLGARMSIPDVLKKYEGGEFVVVGGKWWLADPSRYFLHVVPLSERVEETVINLLNSRIVVKFDEVLREIFIRFQNSFTPEQSISELLAEYGEKTKDGRWRLKPKVAERLTEHDQVVELLAQLGLRSGFAVYADVDPYRASAGVLPVADDVKPIVKEIDAIWHDGKSVAYEFEVEHTTCVTEAINRGSAIPGGPERVIVIPEERVPLLLTRLQRPFVKEGLSRFGWKFMFYDDLKAFADAHRGKGPISSKEFVKLIRPSLAARKARQTKLT